MTSYASQPTPERPVFGPAPPVAAAPRAPGGGQQRAPAGEQWSAQLRDQATGGDLWADQVLAVGQRPGQLGHQPADGTVTEFAGPRHEGDERWAVLSYFALPFLGFLPPLAVYLIKLRTSRFARRHAAQALNLAITVTLYNVSGLILGGLLALDTVQVALLVVLPLLAILWIVTLVYLVLAGAAASRGEYRQIPAWLCAELLR
jgi:uncharacterized Tic20 family protein